MTSNELSGISDVCYNMIMVLCNLKLMIKQEENAERFYDINCNLSDYWEDYVG